ncbi:hypothetical protein QJS10_CPA10g01957 [Acorus calamus]|uniref:Sister chromatid cohesion protein n=1 Tax=Acorus calamus TaxID=4465 RepID=A0AAV9DYP6_ACOCL|nr:hypothetical protein QJS10_CPA10g01957 [Acorus calamus]
MAGTDGFGFERACRLTNTVHSEVLPSLSLPSLPVFFGAPDPEIRLSEDPFGSVAVRSIERTEVLACSGKIAELLGNCDVSYLNLRNTGSAARDSYGVPSILTNEVLKYNPEAFGCPGPGFIKDQCSSKPIFEQKPFQQNLPAFVHGGSSSDNLVDRNMLNDHLINTSRKPKVKKKVDNNASLPREPDLTENQDIITARCCETLEDFCGRAEIHADDRMGEEGESLPHADVKMLVDELLSIRAKRSLHLVPVDTLVRLLNVLDHQIQCGQGLSINENEKADSDDLSSVTSALEATHAALIVMTHQDMPKQIYKEEIIERILDFSRHQIMECMAACDPSYRALQKPIDNGFMDGDEDEVPEEPGSVGRNRRNIKGVRMKRSTGNKISEAVYKILKKLYIILDFLKDLLSIERLPDSCILQLVKTSFSTFLVDNIQLLQLKAISLICGVFISYVQHRSFLLDETLQLLWKLPYSKRAFRAYHLPDEEQKQIQMITGILIQLVQCSANLPEAYQTTIASNSIVEASVDASCPIKCLEAATEACCIFWRNVLQRFTNAKTHDISELKVIMENLVMDLLTTLNLPEYPASATILEVLCVLLLQNAGLKSKDTSARCMAIDILGTIAARLKRDAVACSREKFWILQELISEDSNISGVPDDGCSICHVERSTRSLIACHVCQRYFHKECIEVAGQGALAQDWSCHICICRKQLAKLHSHCKSHCTADDRKKSTKSESSAGTSDSLTSMEIVQQMLLNYLQDSGSEDAHLIARWFYLCLWFKHDSNSQERITYYFARLKSRAILRDYGTTLMSRDLARKISIVLGQKLSFSRGFDKILSLLLASLRENSPVIRARALRAVSNIVEADPEVLCEKNVQCAVEGRFCDSAISVREAALELVGKHIASHPDVGLKYFQKVSERIKDTGISVRKRAIRIIRDMCISNANFSEITIAFIEIISRVNDEESSVQDLVCKTFYEFWFEEPSGTYTRFVDSDSPVPIEVAKKTEQIVDVLRKMLNHHLLITVIKRNLTLDFLPQSSKATGINAVLLASVRRRCELMCRCLLEKILQVAETNNGEDEAQALPFVLALHAFCVVDPTLCAPVSDPAQFVVTLLPYLKSQVDTRTVATLLESIIFVIDAVLPLLRKPPQSVVEELELDLKQMIVRHSFLSVVHACIKCLCSLCKVAGKGASMVEYLIQVFFKQLDGAKVDNKQQLVGRSLFCLGLLIRYGHSLTNSSNDKHMNVSKSLSLLKKYFEVQDFGIRVRSLQALGFVLIAKPECMLENDIGNIIGNALSTDSDSRLKSQALQNLLEYLLDAENQMEVEVASNAGGRNSGDGGSKVPIAAGAGDTNICGGIVQLYWNFILERCVDADTEVRQSALKIVEIVLRQGLVHPITCVPYLIALEADPLEVNTKLAHHLLMALNEKYPSFFESRLGDGLKMSYIFIESLVRDRNRTNGKGKPDNGTFAFARLGISRIYRLIRGNRISRNNFMSSIIRKFESGSWNHSSIPFLIYCIEILASLPFASPDEPLFLVHVINRVMQVRAGALESNMKTWISRSLALSKTSQENHEVPNDFREQNVSNEVTASLDQDESCTISKAILQQFQIDCHAAMALQLLLKLKRHLKIVYSLNDERCQSYYPTEALRPGETLSRQNIPFNLGDVSISLPTSYSEMVEKYQDFKAALKDDTEDYATYTASLKRKRPTPRSSRSGKSARRMGNDGDDNDEVVGDDDWTGGPCRLSFGPGGGQRGNFNTRSNRRL